MPEQGAPREDAGGATIRVLPSGVEFRARKGQTVLDAADEQNVIWPTICHANAECTRCFFEIVEGGGNLSAMEAREEEALDAIRWRGTPRPLERLACCAQVNGDVVVRRRSVRKREEEANR
ncbi:2Fe-2S iron-sulfur cluster-binding protein [Actinomadura sp. KC345]|uniref:2Fe-2S iron-sulfur cluster-binding protein n=1 Tax=Actinomadura sp. KC345 TaxID=2530371 RepID=UPI0014044879|nr:2Fe-2S iron-sulfur cluster-binding protein [Actinomadura sp. KC345]